MKYINFTPTGLAPTQSYRIEISNSITPNVVIYSQQNIVTGQTVVVPIETPGTYIVRLFNMSDPNNICILDEYSEKTISVFFPVISYVVSETDCTTESYTVTLTVTNPSTSGDVQFGWGYTNSCVSVTNWTDNNILSLPSDNNNIYVFVKYDDCCDLVTVNKKLPCVNCSLQITDLVASCSDTIIPPTPENECKTYKIVNGNASSFVWYIDCSSGVLENMVLNPDQEVLICSRGVPSGQSGLTITLVGNNCPST